MAAANIVDNPTITAISEVQNKEAIDPLDIPQEQSEDVNEVSGEGNKETPKIMEELQMVMDEDDHTLKENNLELNQNDNTGDKSYSCSKCDDKFSDQSDCKKHERIHTEESTQLDISK